METEYLQPYAYAAAHPRLAGKRKPATSARVDIIVRVAQLAHWLLADPVGERLKQQRLADEQLLLPQ